MLRHAMTWMLGALLLPAISLAQPEPLFQDSLSDLSSWNAPTEWSISGGALTVNGGGIRLCRVGQAWRNYAVEFDVTINKHKAQWVIRADGERDCCFIQLTASDNPYAPSCLRQHLWKAGAVNGISEDPLPLEVEPGHSYHVRCEAVGTTVQTIIDGKVRSQWDVPERPSGTIGFRGDATDQAVYRNLKVLPCGTLTPITSRQNTPKATQVMDPYFNPPFRAEWIWGPGDALDRTFRASFNLSARALKARLWITADNAFVLYVNGKRVGSGDNWQSPHVFDLKPFLHLGRNVLAVSGHNDGPGSAGVLAEGNILLEDGRNVPLVSTSAWRTAVSPAPDWQSVSFDDSAWAPAISEGRHPVAPWGEQVTWTLPYLRAEELAQARSMTVTAHGNTVFASVDLHLARALKQAHPAQLRLAFSDGHELIAGYAQPGVPTGAAGAHRVKLTVHLRSGAYVPPGRYRARLEFVGLHLTGGAEKLHTVLAWGAEIHRKPLPLAKRPMAPDLFTDQFGGKHHYRWSGNWLEYDGRRMVPLEHGDGAYWCIDDATQHTAIEACRSAAVATRVQRDGLTEEPIRLRLLDSLVCADAASEKAHAFSEDEGYGGQSRLLTIGDRTYRVTSNRRHIAYFAYTLHCLRPSRPHLLVFETPNDRERYTTVRVQPPWRNVGCGPYTGRDLPCDGNAYQAGFLFYPEQQQVRVTVSRLPCELKIEPESGGAISRMWLFEVVDNLAEHPAEVAPTAGPERRIGLSLTHPAYLYELYGRYTADLAGRLTAIKSFVDYAGFVGMNHLEYNAINGADTSEVAYYHSRIWPQFNGDCDLFRELLPAAKISGMTAIPCLTSLAFDINRFTNAPWISPLTFQIDKDGIGRRDFFAGRGNDNTLPDPLRPEVQKVFLDTLRELCEGAKGSPAVTGIAFRLNGKIGLCYVGYDETARADTCGFSPWDLSEFQKDTGVRLPGWDDALIQRWVDAWKAHRTDDPAIWFIPGAYDWIHANCWNQWTDWRCHRMAALILKARDLVRSYRHDWNLVVKCDMPSETPDRNILWPAGTPVRELMRAHGFDPLLFAREPGIVLQQGYFIGGGEYFHSAGEGNPYYQNPEAWATFDYQPGLEKLYRTPAGTSAEFYHNYWEENGMAKLGEFGTTFWGAGMMYPRGRAFFRPVLHAIRVSDARTLALFSWERGSEGHEGELRRFCRAYRAMPAVTPKPFAGQIDIASGPTTDDTLWVRQVGSRVALINENEQSRVVVVTMQVPAGKAIYDYASQRRLTKPGKARRAVIELGLDAYDLRVLGVE